jgi:hypothetical protein
VPSPGSSCDGCKDAKSLGLRLSLGAETALLDNIHAAIRALDSALRQGLPAPRSRRALQFLHAKAARPRSPSPVEHTIDHRHSDCAVRAARDPCSKLYLPRCADAVRAFNLPSL